MTASLTQLARDRLRRPALVVAFAYFVLLGGTPLGDVSGRVLLVNLALGAPLVWMYIRSVGRDADLVDRLALGSYLVFLVPILLSAFPRQSLDVALSTLGLMAAFHFARRELRDAVSRRWVLALLTGLALVVGTAALVAWGGLWVRWIADFGTAPPRDAPFSGLIFGHRHDVAILLALCAPAAFGWRGRWGRMLTVATLAVVGVAVALEGSRNVWLAAALATPVAGFPLLVSWLRRHPISRRTFAAVLAALTVVGVFIVATGVWSRVTDLTTLAPRALLWTTSLDIWRSDLVSGLGPGSFPWLLQLTDYFTHHSFTPRHPDNAIAQLLAEGGLIGVAAGGMVIGMLVLGIVRSHRADLRAIWSLAFLGFTSLFANPTDFGFLLALGMAWAALAMPPTPRVPREPRGRTWPSPYRASLAASGVLLAAGVAIGVGAVVHDEATRLVGAGRTAEAERWLRLAVTLDPGMALYERELGVVLLAEADPEAAIHLARAVSLNPSDAVAQRALAEAELARDRPAVAAAAAEAAVALKRSDVANLMIHARAAAGTGNDERALDLVAEALAADPTLAGVDMVELGMPFTTQEALDAALAYWLAGRPIPGPVVLQPAWLSGLAGRADLLPAAEAQAREALNRPEEADIARLLHLALSCRLPEALALSDAILERNAGQAEYWEARYLTEGVVGEPAPMTESSGAIVSSAVRLTEANFALRNDLVAVSTDGWGYGHAPMFPPDIRSAMPSVLMLHWSWLRDAQPIAAATLPSSPLGTCAAR